MNFTEEQKRVFQFVANQQGHGIINAVAGSGKTTTIMECARFVADKRSILFCAFNTSISREIARKFQATGLSEVTVKTIHALGRQILQDHVADLPIKLEENKYKQLLESPEIKRVLRPWFEKIVSISGFETSHLDDKKDFAVKNLLFRVCARLLEINQKFRATLTRNELADFEKLLIHFGIFTETDLTKKNVKQEIKAYFECHKILLAAGNRLSRETMIIDYTDMLYLPYEWNLHPVEKYDFLFIDECQDLSKAQFAVAAKYGRKNGRILAVGDPSQSIYGFTGADIESFDRVRAYTKATEFPLTTCFRCPEKVVELAQAIRKDITGNKTRQGMVKTIPLDDVVGLARPGDLIISRLRAPMVLLVFSFIDKNVKVQIHQDEVHEIIHEIKSIFKYHELTTPIAAYQGTFDQLKSEVINRCNWMIRKNAERITDSAERIIYMDTEKKYLENKLNFLHKKYELWKNECPTVEAILLRIREFISSPHNAIKLSTIHRAKGLENERVFILNYDELPYCRIQQKDWEQVQELNLKYVAITRSLKELYLVKSKKVEVIEKAESLFDNLPFGKN